MPVETLKLYECYARLEDLIEKWEELRRFIFVR